MPSVIKMSWYSWVGSYALLGPGRARGRPHRRPQQGRLLLGRDRHMGLEPLWVLDD